MSNTTKITVLGASGRMGQAIIQAINASEQSIIVGAYVRSGSPVLGQTVAGTDIVYTDALVGLIQQADIVIDFTSHDFTPEIATLCAQHKTALVVGTTGLTEDEEAMLEASAQHIPIVYAPNMSVGVNLLMRLTEMAAKVMSESDIEIVELHHKHKKDAPSGTALGLGKSAAKALGVRLEDEAVFTREGITGEREDGKIGFATVRGGDIIGEHTVYFCAEGERVELTHKATSRTNFSQGAVRASQWLHGKCREGITSGLFTMQDVLGI